MAPVPLAFMVRRGELELVKPAGPTPREVKRLSDLNDQEGFRFYISLIFFYRTSPRADDLVRVIRRGLAATLVHYYPMAGRLREMPGRKLVVDCTGEGVCFVEADADVALDEFGDAVRPPVPCAGEFLFLPVSQSAVVVNRPLLYVQVTRLRCGRFVFGIQVCHCIVDAAGVVQFLQAVGELAGGMEAPRVRPVWTRHLFEARDPPRVEYQHPEYELPSDAANDKLRPGDKLVHSAFVFGPEEISVLREQLPPPLRSRCSRFLLLSAFMWRCRTMALGYEPGDEVRFMFLMNARGHEKLPKGFYGNALTFGVARTTAGELCSGTLGGGVELIVAAMARIMAIDYGRPRFTTARTYLVTDLTKLKMHEVDLGWGMPVYGGPTSQTTATFHIPAISGRISVAMCLPPSTMDRFKANVRAGLAVVSPKM
ncbi:unnamed protein product [Alopecurus aequalis]